MLGLLPSSCSELAFVCLRIARQASPEHCPSVREMRLFALCVVLLAVRESAAEDVQLPALRPSAKASCCISHSRTAPQHLIWASFAQQTGAEAARAAEASVTGHRRQLEETQANGTLTPQVTHANGTVSTDPVLVLGRCLPPCVCLSC